MSAPTIMRRAQTFLAERRRPGFQARNPGYALISFARFVERRRHHGPLTVALMAEWARRDKTQRGTAETWARRLKILRPFARWMRQFEPRTAVPDESIFGPVAVRAAAKQYPDLATRHISPHTIRHSTAMRLLQSGEDPSVIALWLGHENPTTTHHYVEADLSMKTRALARLQDPKTRIHRYRAPASLLSFLKGL